MASMQFWGIEVKGKEPSSVKLEECQVIHISQATLGEVKKDNEPVMIHVKVGAQKLVMGILSQDNPQLSFDLMFDQDFEISHNWKNGSIHILGYESDLPYDEEYSDFSDEDEDVPTLVPLRENGKPVAAAPDAAKSAAKTNKDDRPKPKEKVDDEADSDDDEDSDGDDSNEDMLGGNDESDEDEDSDDDDEDDEDSSEEEETPKVSAVGKKRSKPDAKTPEPETKKARLAALQILEGKKGINTTTSQPSKKAEKTRSANKSTTKSGGQISCGSYKM